MSSAAPAAAWAEEYSITCSLPTVDEHIRLRVAARLTRPSVDLAAAAHAQALTSSVHCLVARLKSTGEAVGMLRLIGDGHLFLQVVDMAVTPAHQGKGLGKALVASMSAWLDQNAPHAYTGLIADPGKAPRIYTANGWVPTSGTAMKRNVQKRLDSGPSQHMLVQEAQSTS